MAGPRKIRAAPVAAKRKAAEDASPVAVKKSKSADSKAPKASKSATPSKKSKNSKAAEEDAPVAVEKEEEEEEPVSDEEEVPEAADEAQALAEAIDSGDEDEAEIDSTVAFKKGQDVGKIPASAKKSRKSESEEEPGVVYIGRLPHGFYEHELKGYFSQFGPINKLRLSRSKRTGASKHFAFIEFEEESTAEIVSKTMDKYLLFGHLLSCKVVPKSQIHEALWKGSNKRFKKIPWNKMAGAELKKPKTESSWAGKIEREELRRLTRSKKLKAIGYDFDEPKLKAVENAQTAPEAIEAEAPKAIEAAPVVQSEEPEAEPEAPEAVEEDESKKATKQKAANGTKAGKKGKAGAKGKKAKA